MSVLTLTPEQKQEAKDKYLEGRSVPELEAAPTFHEALIELGHLPSSDDVAKIMSSWKLGDEANPEVSELVDLLESANDLYDELFPGDRGPKPEEPIDNRIPTVNLEIKEVMSKGHKVFYVEDQHGQLHDLIIPHPDYEKAKSEVQAKYASEEQYHKETTLYINAMVSFLQDRMKISMSMAYRLIKSIWEAKA